MTPQRGLERRLEAWLADGPTELSERAFDEAVERLRRQRQRPAWRVSWRDTDVNADRKALVAVAAIVIVAIVGWINLPSRSTGPGGTLSPTRGAAGSPRPIGPWWNPQNRPCGPAGCAGALTSGDHGSRSLRPPVRYTVPAGWINAADYREFYSLFPDTEANQASVARSGDAAQSITILTNADLGAVDFCGAMPTGPEFVMSRDALVSALLASDSLAATGPVPISLGGLTGQRLDLQVAPNWSGTCERDVRDVRQRVALLDRPGGGTVLVKVEAATSADFEAFVASASPVVETFRFNP